MVLNFQTKLISKRSLKYDSQEENESRLKKRLKEEWTELNKSETKPNIPSKSLDSTESTNHSEVNDQK